MRSRLLRFAFAASLSLGSAGAYALDHSILAIEPLHPTSADSVLITLDVDACDSVVSVARVGAELRIGLEHGACFSTPQDAPPMTVSLGRLPAGVYAVMLATNLSALPSRCGTLTVEDRADTAAVVPRDAADLSDTWWDPTRPGAGLLVTVHPDGALFAAFFTHDDEAGAPTWYTLQDGSFASASVWRGTLYRTSVGATGPVTTAVGEAELDFDDAGGARVRTGVFAYSIDGTRAFRRIERLPF